jgi:hypothetical protein
MLLGLGLDEILTMLEILNDKSECLVNAPRFRLR